MAGCLLFFVDFKIASDPKVLIQSFLILGGSVMIQKIQLQENLLREYSDLEHRTFGPSSTPN